jgi:hypothetical protein
MTRWWSDADVNMVVDDDVNDDGGGMMDATSSKSR